MKSNIAFALQIGNPAPLQSELQRLKAQQQTKLGLQFSRNGRDILRRLKRLEGAPLIQTASFRTFLRQHGPTRAWADGCLSTFGYLLKLNAFANRSFRDASISLIFAWVFSDFDSFDLTGTKRFRGLRFPILT
jgi:hypothetical protein